MVSKTNPEKISKVVQKYILEYATKKKYRYETIYTMKPDDVRQVCNFADYKKAKIFLCFYNFSAEDYDKMDLDDIHHFVQADLQFPHDKISVTESGMEFGVNVCVPARDGVVDKALLNEVLSHELMHAYRTYNEYMDGHISHSSPSKRRKIDEATKRKFTYTQKVDRYNNLIWGIRNDGNIRDNFYWIGYSLTVDEINATLAGVDAFLFEHDGDYTKLPQCRSIDMIKTMRGFIDEVQKFATDEDWEYCRENALYIHENKNESLGRFKSRYIAYYTKQVNHFEEKVKKLVDKYKMKKAQQKIQKQKNKNNPVYKAFLTNSIAG